MTTASELIEKAEALAKPCLWLVPSLGANSYLGGTPTLPNGLSWPRWQGRHLAFLAQIDLGDAPKGNWPEWMPPDGRLLFFYDSQQSTWGLDPADRGSWSVVYVDDETSQERRKVLEFAPRVAAFPKRPLRMAWGRSFPSEERLGVYAAHLDAAESNELSAYLDQVRLGVRSSHQVFGLPTPIQTDEMELDCQLAATGVYVRDPEEYADRRRQVEAEASEWELLLQLDSDDDAEMMWDDVGTLYFWIRRDDARRRDFSNVWMVLQCS